jgi:hypothetical protein
MCSRSLPWTLRSNIADRIRAEFLRRIHLGDLLAPHA